MYFVDNTPFWLHGLTTVEERPFRAASKCADGKPSGPGLALLRG